jgi:hypothetical protein
MSPSAAEIQTLLKSLKNPRFTTDDNSANAPITLDGVADNKPIQFVASPNDVMDYGRSLWQEVRDGKYGKIGSYNPSIEELKEHISIACGASITSIIKETGLDDSTRTTTLELAKTILISNNWDTPEEGAINTRLSRVADLCGVAVEALPNFIRSFEELRFGIADATMQLRTSVDASKNKGSLSVAIDAFDKELKMIINTYNMREPPKRLSHPAPIKISGL